MPLTTWRNGGAALLGVVALSLGQVPPVGAMEILGQAGVLGEWELTGHLTESTPGTPRRRTGALSATWSRRSATMAASSPDSPNSR